MDQTILVFSSVAIFSLIASLPLVFRIIHAYDATSWYIRLVCIFGCIMSVIWWVGAFGPLEAFVLMMMLYLLASIIFLFGVFGILEASITLHILLTLQQSANGRMREQDIATQYSIHHIVQKRLARFLWTQDIRYVDGSYELVQKTSLYKLREYLLSALKWLYP